jgi:hypothetical protein
MHGGKQSRPRHAGLAAGNGPGTCRDRPGDAQGWPGGDPDDPQYQAYAVPAGQDGDYLAEAGGDGRPARAHGFRSRGDRSRRRRQIRAARRTIAGRHPVATAVLGVIVLLTPVWFSLGNALANPGLGTSVAARGAEWFRGHGGSGIVNWAENLWYSHHPPPAGGAPARSAIPSLGPAAAGPVHAAVAHLPAPRRLTSPAGRELAGEGAWHPAGRRVDGLPAVYETWVRPDAVHTSLVVGVAWMDTKLLTPALYSGSTIPGGGPFQHTAPVSGPAARTLVAAFNSGFLMTNANGGYYTDGRAILPLRNGAASFVIYRNGTADIAAWRHGAAVPADVVAVRQNLDLLVEGGKPIPGLNPSDSTRWGFTLGNAVYVWRSGLGITADGALVYVGGPGLNITTLARILARAGAVRAMELDINTDWVDFATYHPHSPSGLADPANGTNLLPGMYGGPNRYFAAWWPRDFITMSARTTAQAAATPGR